MGNRAFHRAECWSEQKGTYAADSAHHGVHAAITDRAYAGFGSGITVAEHGEPPQPSVVMMREDLYFPPFCGGANSHPEEVMADVEMAETPTAAEEHMVQSPLDYVLQNLQIRLGNPRNRCFANAPFRLWSWAGSFLEGPKMWNRTTAAVMAALTDDEVVQITDLPNLMIECKMMQPSFCLNW